MRIDRVVTSGLVRTIQTAEAVVSEFAAAPPFERMPDREEIRGGELSVIPDEDSSRRS